jgi:hypothetical protein
MVPKLLDQGVGRFSGDVGRERQIGTGERWTQTSAGKHAERIPPEALGDAESRRPRRRNALHVARRLTSGHGYAMPARALGAVSLGA